MKCLGVMFGAAFLALSALLSGAQERSERRAKLDGRPLVAHLTSEDKAVVIEKIVRPLRIALPELSASLPHHSDVIAVVYVESVRPRLVAGLYGKDVVTSAETANAIFSVIRGSVERNLKGPFKDGDMLELVEEGGSARIRGVDVSYVVPWERPFESGKRYLVFAILNDEDEFIPNVAYKEPSPGNLLISSYIPRPDEPADPFEQLSLEQAVARVENLLR